ncbi:hypothetical protein [Acinetobacter guillouiae]|uniref:hypothetical protein n=1 Tax=Acinetobacter guillouiae TaxID=106649 RepID=UPI002650E8C9|nr:hypothetical protein [Acinetobacter sp.]
MLTKNKLRLFLFSLMIGLLLIGCVYLISIFHKLDFVESNLLKFKVVNICMRLPSEKIPTYLWTSIDYEIKENQGLEQNERVDFYTALLVTCGDKISRNHDQSLIFYESVKLEDTELLINDLKEFISRHRSKNVSGDEIQMLENWVEYFDVKLKERSYDKGK